MAAGGRYSEPSAGPSLRGRRWSVSGWVDQILSSSVSGSGSAVSQSERPESRIEQRKESRAQVTDRAK